MFLDKTFRRNKFAKRNNFSSKYDVKYEYLY